MKTSFNGWQIPGLRDWKSVIFLKRMCVSTTKCKMEKKIYNPPMFWSPKQHLKWQVSSSIPPPKKKVSVVFSPWSFRAPVTNAPFRSCPHPFPVSPPTWEKSIRCAMDSWVVSNWRCKFSWPFFDPSEIGVVFFSLVVETTHLENMLVKMGSSSQNFGVKIKNSWKPPPSFSGGWGKKIALDVYTLYPHLGGPNPDDPGFLSMTFFRATKILPIVTGLGDWNPSNTPKK